MRYNAIIVPAGGRARGMDWTIQTAAMRLHILKKGDAITMMRISKRCQAVTGSLTLEIDAKAKEMKARGLDVVGFGAGEPDFDTPEHIRNAAKDALDRGMTRYTPASGMLELKKAVCDKLLRDNGLSYQPQQIVVSNGAKHSLFNTFQALLDEGDEVIVPGPYWVSYPELVVMAGGVPVTVQAQEENNFKLSPSQIEAAVTDRTRAIVLNSPNNPNGFVYTRDELKAIGDIAIRHDLIIVSDEIYEYLVYDGAEHVSIASLSPELKERTIVINGMSKAYAMTGWRIGYTASPLHVAKAMTNFQSHSTSNPNSIAQWAALAALSGPDDQLKNMVAEFDRRRRRMVELINGIPGLSCKPPKGAFYVMMNISGLIGKKLDGVAVTGSMSFTELLLESKQVAVVPGIGFGADRYVRLSYATNMENIEKGLARIREFAASLQD